MMTSERRSISFTESLDFKQPWQPHSFQKLGVRWLLEHAAAGLLLDPGSGKTAITLAALKVLKARGVFRRALLLAPLRPCHLVWPAELAKWEDFAGLKAIVLHGPRKDVALAKALQDGTDLFILNYDGLDWLLGATKEPGLRRVRVNVDLRRFQAYGFDTLIIDELSRLKHPGTQRFKALKQVLPYFKRRWGLTGSPAANGLMGLFGQCYALDQGRALGPYVTHFRAKYFFQGYDGFSWELKPGAEAQIYACVRDLLLRTESVGVKLPPLTTVDVPVTLPDAATRVYRDLERDLLVKLDERVVTAANAGVATLKCQQVAAGGLYVQDMPSDRYLVHKKDDAVNLHFAKADAVKELVEELQGQSLLVAYGFRHDLNRLRTVLGEATPAIGGETGARESQALVESWNRGELPVLLVHPQAAALGLNLQAGGHHLCWHTLTWDYELYDQLVRRLWRQGQARPVTVHRVVARGTVDEDILRALQAKRQGQQALFEALRERIRETHQA